MFILLRAKKSTGIRHGKFYKVPLPGSSFKFMCHCHLHIGQIHLFAKSFLKDGLNTRQKGVFLGRNGPISRIRDSACQLASLNNSG